MKKWGLALLTMCLALASCGQADKNKDMKILYVYDALCGWCYGFSPRMQAFAEKHADEVEVEVISGGMIRGERIGPIGEVAPYISWAYKDVEKATGIEFGKDFLEGTLKDGTAIFTSIPPSIALSIVKDQKPEDALRFAAALQKAIYFHGMEPENIEAYGSLAADFGFDPAQFTAAMGQAKYLEMAEADFRLASQMGVSGFPTILLEKGDKIVIVARGAVGAEQLETNYRKAKEALNQ